MKKEPRFDSISGFALTSAAKKGDLVSIGFQINIGDNFSSEGKLIMAQNALDIVVYPEIIRKALNKKLNPKFVLRFAHVIMFSNPIRNEVLLNDDVKIRAHIRYVEGKSIQKGQTIKEEDIEEILGLYPYHDVDPDAAQILLVKLKGKWHFAADLIYSRKRVKNLLKTSDKFMDLAKSTFDKKSWSPFIDNLFTVSELLAQSILLLRYYQGYSTRQSHDKTSELFKGFCETGNASMEFYQTYNELWKLRRKARYLEGTKSEEFSLDEKMGEKFLTDITKMNEFANNLIKTIDSKSKPQDGYYISLGTKNAQTDN